MKKRTISVLLAAAMIASSLAAGAVTVHAEEEKKDKYVIGMSQCNLGEPWRVAMNDQIAMAAEKYPEFEVVFADAAQDNSKQIADIENFVQMGVDLIIASPNEATPLTNAVSSAYDAGIPVILLDRKIDGDKYTQFIGAESMLQMFFFRTAEKFVRSKALREPPAVLTETMVSVRGSKRTKILKLLQQTMQTGFVKKQSP